MMKKPSVDTKKCDIVTVAGFSLFFTFYFTFSLGLREVGRTLKCRCLACSFSSFFSANKKT